MEAYSSLNLTQVASDRLIALAGVASEFGSALRSSGPPECVNYICGLWCEEIARDLHWERADRSGRPFARVPGFPSWSWASQGRIKAGEEGTNTNASKIEAAGVRWNTPWSIKSDSFVHFTLEMVRCVSGAADQTGGHHRLEERDPLAISLPLSLSSDYGIESRFLALRITGRMARDFHLKKEWPGGQCELDRAARLTANWLVNPHLLRRVDKHDKRKDEVYADKGWHQIIRGGIRLGWVSFDDTNLLVNNTDSGPCIAGDRRRAIFALPLSSMGRIPVDVEHFTFVHVYALLFVAKCEARIGDECCFERVGVGRVSQESAGSTGYDSLENRKEGFFPSMKETFWCKESTFWLV